MITPKIIRTDGGPDRYVCDNCERLLTFAALADISDLGERIDAGGIVPAGECPTCGALCYPDDPEPAQLALTTPRTWVSNVMLIDTDSGNQIGECWIVEVEAPDVAAAREAIRTKAWEDVDTRLNDVRIDILDGPEDVTEGGAALATLRTPR